LYLGGHFANLGGTPRTGLAAVDPGTGQTLNWAPQPDGPIDALAVGSDGVYAGGSFASFGPTAQRGVASFGPGVGEVSSSRLCPSATTSSNGAGGGALSSGVGPSDSQPVIKRARVVLALSKLRLTAPVFRLPAVSGPGAPKVTGPLKRVSVGTTFSFMVSLPAQVTLRISRELFGRRHGNQCVAASQRRHGRRCTRYQLYGTLKRSAKQGANTIAFSGLLGGKALPAGIYTAKLTATEPGAKRSVSRLARFEVVDSSRPRQRTRSQSA
jgi:hypothetical protein